MAFTPKRLVRKLQRNGLLKSATVHEDKLLHRLHLQALLRERAIDGQITLLLEARDCSGERYWKTMLMSAQPMQVMRWIWKQQSQAEGLICIRVLSPSKPDTNHLLTLGDR